jgi:exosortase E/protease (VPEID-CTERM system)
MWVFLAAYFWFSRRRLRFPQVLLLIPLGTVVIWFANTMRITLLILIGTWGWPQIALGGFHSQAGWLIFGAIALGLVAVSNRSRYFVKASAADERTVKSGASKVRSNLAAPYLIPFLAILATTMLTGAFSSGGTNALYPLRVLVVAGVLWWMRDSYREMKWTWSWEAVAAGAGVAVFWLLVIRVGDAPQQMAIPSVAGGWLVLWWPIRLLGYVVTVPIAEELAFRGYLTRRLISADFHEVAIGAFTWTSWIGSALFFGLMHGQHWLIGSVAGLVFAAVMYRRGQLADAVVAHMTTNGLIAAYAAGTGNWSLLS